jgi:hypothetical protein
MVIIVLLITQMNIYLCYNYLFIGFATDQGSNYVKCFKPAIIPGDDYSASEDDEESQNNTIIQKDSDDLNESVENDLYFLQNLESDEEAGEFNSNGHLNAINSIEQEQISYTLEISKILEYTDKLKFSHSIEVNGSSNDIDLDLSEDFLLTKSPVESFEIDIGTSKHARYSCACHKCNIAVRLAIKGNRSLNKVVAKLSKFAAKHKNTLSSVKLCVAKKVRFRINNETRWASVFLLLECFHKAYCRQLFNNDFKCPVSLEVIEQYLQILLPAFQFNLIMQKTSSTIADVLPCLQVILSKWSRFNVTGTYKDLCNSLIKV